MEIQNHEHTSWLVVTDLDGTLLDHHTYRYDEALPALTKLKENHIPVIFNSSKTASEIEELRVQLNNQHPFVVENGSGILLCKNYFSLESEEVESFRDYWEVTLGKPRQQIIDLMETLPESLKKCYRSYHQSNIEDIINMTGLGISDAEKSADRYYTEPLLWRGSATEKQLFFRELHKKHIHYTEGGRFIHLMGHTNKGVATSWLKDHYIEEYETNVKVIALGDGENDVDMLKAADIAVVVRSPVNKPPKFEHPCKIHTNAIGPAGWAEAISTIFFSSQ